MRRRDVLVAVGSVTAGGLAGCVAGDTGTDATTPTGSTASSTENTATPVGATATPTAERSPHRVCWWEKYGLCGVETPHGARDGDHGPSVGITYTSLERDGSDLWIDGTVTQQVGGALSCVAVTGCFFTASNELLETTKKTKPSGLEVDGEWEFALEYAGSRPDEVTQWEVSALASG